MAVCSGGGSNEHARFFLRRLCAGALLPRRFRGVSPVHRGRRADLDPHRRPRWCHRGNFALRERGLQPSHAAPRSWRLAAAARLLRSAVARTVEAVTTPDLGRLSCVRSLRRSVEKRAHGWNQGAGGVSRESRSSGSVRGSGIPAAPGSTSRATLRPRGGESLTATQQPGRRQLVTSCLGSPRRPSYGRRRSARSFVLGGGTRRGSTCLSTRPRT